MYLFQFLKILFQLLYAVFDSWISGGVLSLESLLSGVDGGQQMMQILDVSFTVIHSVWSRFSNLRNGETLLCPNLVQLCFAKLFFLEEGSLRQSTIWFFVLKIKYEIRDMLTA